jgi:hypothetical protein
MISMGDALFQTGFHSLPKNSNCAAFVTRARLYTLRKTQPERAL